jgi:hypothetical protein
MIKRDRRRPARWQIRDLVAATTPAVMAEFTRLAGPK